MSMKQTFIKLEFSSNGYLTVIVLNLPVSGMEYASDKLEISLLINTKIDDGARFYLVSALPRFRTVAPGTTRDVQAEMWEALATPGCWQVSEKEPIGPQIVIKGQSPGVCQVLSV